MFGEEPANGMGRDALAAEGGGVWLMMKLMIFLLLLTCQFLSKSFCVSSHHGGLAGASAWKDDQDCSGDSISL